MPPSPKICTQRETTTAQLLVSASFCSVSGVPQSGNDLRLCPAAAECAECGCRCLFVVRVSIKVDANHEGVIFGIRRSYSRSRHNNSSSHRESLRDKQRARDAARCLLP